MKETKNKVSYTLTIQSHLWNNSDYSEYNNYTLEGDNGETIFDALRYARQLVETWSKNDKDGVVYYVERIRNNNNESEVIG